MARKLRLIDFSILSRKGSLETLRNEQEDLCPSRQKAVGRTDSFNASLFCSQSSSALRLRFFRLDFQELNIREAIAHSISQYSFSGPVQLFDALGLPLLPGSFWLQHVWHSLTGTSEFALRSLSALLGTLAVPLVYRLAKELRLSAFATLTANHLDGLEFVRYLYQPGGSSQFTQSDSYHRQRGIGTEIHRRWREQEYLGRIRALHGRLPSILKFSPFSHFWAQNLYVLFLLARDWRGVGSGSTLRPAGSLLLRWIVAQIAIGVLVRPVADQRLVWDFRIYRIRHSAVPGYDVMAEVCKLYFRSTCAG